MMTFVHPWVLAIGIPLASAPLAIHWLLAPRAARLPLPTLRFLRIAGAFDPKRRLRSLLLLAARTLVLLALAAAFARPEIRALPRAGGGRALVLIIDASASMQAEGGSISPWERARAEALATIEALGPADEANVVLAAARPTLLAPFFTGDRAEIARALREAAPTFERADARAAVRLALEEIDKVATREPEVGIIADLQRASWADVDLAAIPETVRLWIVEVGGGSGGNIAVTDVRVTPPAPLPGEPARLRYRVSNFGTEAVRIRATVRIAGEVAASRTLEIGPLDARSDDIAVRFPTPGLREIEVRIESTRGADPFPIDDVRHVALRAHDRLPVLVVSRAPRDAADPGRFFAMALAPAPGEGAFAPEAVAGEDLTRERTAGASILVLLGPLTLGVEARDAVRAHLGRGGGILAAIGSPEDGAWLEAIGFDGSIGPVVPEEARLSNVRFDAPPFDRFRGSEKAVFAPALRRTARVRAAGGEALASFDGEPAVLRATAGGGLVIIWAFSPDPASPLIRSDVFVPLLQETANALRLEAAPSRDLAPGDAPAIVLPRPAGSFVDPRGRPIRPRVEARGGRVVASFDPLALPGIYRAIDGGETVDAFAVGIDPDESDPAAVPPARILPPDRAAAVIRSDGASLSPAVAGLPLWPALLLAALVLLVLEGVIVLIDAIDARAARGSAA